MWIIHGFRVMLKMLIYHYRQPSFENRRKWTKCGAPPPPPPLERKGLRFFARDEALLHPELLSFQRLLWAIEYYFTHELSVASLTSIRCISPKPFDFIFFSLLFEAFVLLVVIWVAFFVSLSFFYFLYVHFLA